MINRTGGGRCDREEVADVEQDLQHQLVPHVGAVQVDHAALIGRQFCAFVGFAVDGFEVGQDSVAGAHPL